MLNDQILYSNLNYNQKFQMNTGESKKGLIITIPKWINIYAIASIFPTLSVFTCWGVYYGLGHNDSVIRTISETVNPFPENRIFPVTMCMECVFLSFVMWLRNSITEAFSKEKNIKMNKRLFLMKLCLPLMVYGLSTLSLLTLLDHAPIHLSSALIFFSFASIYMFLCDSTGKELGWKINTLSQLVTFCIPAVLILHNIAIGVYGPKSNTMLSAGALLQYLMCLCIFLKIFIFQFEIPKVTITNCFDDYNKKQQ